MIRLAAIAVLAILVVTATLMMRLPEENVGPGDARNTPNTAWLQEAARGEMTRFIAVEAGARTPDHPFVDADGQSFTFDDFAGRVLLVNFWATWCAPCRHEMPALDRLQQALGGDDFTVMAISIDNNGPSVAEPFLRDVNVEHMAIFYDSRRALSRAWAVHGLPVTVLLDRQGRELARLVGPAEWDSADARALIEAAISQQDLPQQDQ
ncbi:MAG: redoxin family protein [Sphingomonadales bacterium]